MSACSYGSIAVLVVVTDEHRRADTAAGCMNGLVDRRTCSSAPNPRDRRRTTSPRARVLQPSAHRGPPSPPERREVGCLRALTDERGQFEHDLALLGVRRAVCCLLPLACGQCWASMALSIAPICCPANVRPIWTRHHGTAAEACWPAPSSLSTLPNAALAPTSSGLRLHVVHADSALATQGTRSAPGRSGRSAAARWRTGWTGWRPGTGRARCTQCCADAWSAAVAWAIARLVAHGACSTRCRPLTSPPSSSVR